MGQAVPGEASPSAGARFTSEHFRSWPWGRRLLRAAGARRRDQPPVGGVLSVCAQRAPFHTPERNSPDNDPHPALPPRGTQARRPALKCIPLPQGHGGAGGGEPRGWEGRSEERQPGAGLARGSPRPEGEGARRPGLSLRFPVNNAPGRGRPYKCRCGGAGSPCATAESGRGRGQSRRLPRRRLGLRLSRRFRTRTALRRGAEPRPALRGGGRPGRAAGRAADRQGVPARALLRALRLRRGHGSGRAGGGAAGRAQPLRGGAAHLQRGGLPGGERAAAAAAAHAPRAGAGGLQVGGGCQGSPSGGGSAARRARGGAPRGAGG